MEDLENLISAFIILELYAGEGTSLGSLVEGSFQKPVKVLKEELAEEIRCIVKNEEE